LTEKIDYDKIRFFKVDLAMWIAMYVREHTITNWREINKVMDDFIESWNENPERFSKYINDNI